MKRRSLINESKVDWKDHTEGTYPRLYNCNIYLGCQHDCRYCYSRMMYTRYHKQRFQERPWSNAEPVNNAVELARKEVKKKVPGRIMFCSMCDPYQAIEATTGLARRVLEVLLDSEFLVLIMTKSDLVRRDFDIIQGHGNVELGLTVTSMDALPNWEPGAPDNPKRIRVLQEAHDRGIKTFVSMEPVIPRITFPIQVMEELSPWVDRWVIGALNYVKGMKTVKHKFYSEGVPKWEKHTAEHGLKVLWKKELKRYL